tara:strand:+ start:329 stop:454 length:126 start_codon:yes stop_codon:yes gene_type:complete
VDCTDEEEEEEEEEELCVSIIFLLKDKTALFSHIQNFVEKW